MTRHAVPILVALLLACVMPCTKSFLTPYYKNRPTFARKPELDPAAVVHFTKNLYRDLGASGEANYTETVIDKYRPRFEELNVSSDGRFGQAIASLLEMRMLDLQASVRHARRVQTVVRAFDENAVEA
jgi:hypothetical protein